MNPQKTPKNQTNQYIIYYIFSKSSLKMLVALIYVTLQAHVGDFANCKQHKTKNNAQNIGLVGKTDVITQHIETCVNVNISGQA